MVTQEDITSGASRPDARGRTRYERVAAPLGILGVLLISLVAGWARLLQVDRLPGGLTPAEAEHGLLARGSREAGLSWLIEASDQLSAPLGALIALTGAFDGFDTSTPRIAAAIAGGGSVLFTGLWLRRELGAIWGIAGGIVIAGMFWHLIYSRLGIAPVAGALALAAMLWVLAEAWKRTDREALPWYGVLGLLAGIGYLSTPALRLLLFTLLLMLAIALYRSRTSGGAIGIWRWLVASSTALLAILPYLLDQFATPERLTPWTPTPGLPGEDVTNLLTLPGAIIDSFIAVALPAGSEPGLNLPRDGFLTVLMLPWAAIGLIALFRISDHPALRDRFIAGGIGIVALITGISAIDAGHPGQLVVISPLIAGLIVLGFRGAIVWAQVRAVQLALAVLAISGMVGNAAWSADRYVEWADEPATKAAMHAGAVEALEVANHIETGEPVFIQGSVPEPINRYLTSTVRRHVVPGNRHLFIPLDDDGYLLTPAELSRNIAIDELLDELPAVTVSRESTFVDAYRLDERLRERTALSVPSVMYGNGLLFHGHALRIGANRRAHVTLSWRMPAGAGASTLDVRLATTSSDQVDPAASVQLLANPLDQPIYQLTVASFEIPPNIAEANLELRVRDSDGSVVSTWGLTDDGYLLLNRYGFGS